MSACALRGITKWKTGVKVERDYEASEIMINFFFLDLVQGYNKTTDVKSSCYFFSSIFCGFTKGLD